VRKLEGLLVRPLTKREPGIRKGGRNVRIQRTEFDRFHLCVQAKQGWKQLEQG
jgi:hypothetical protein